MWCFERIDILPYLKERAFSHVQRKIVVEWNLYTRSYYLCLCKYNNPPTLSKGIVWLLFWWFMVYSSCQARKALALSPLIGRVSIHSFHSSVSSDCASTNSTNVILPSCCQFILGRSSANYADRERWFGVWTYTTNRSTLAQTTQQAA